VTINVTELNTSVIAMQIHIKFQPSSTPIGLI